MSLTPDRECGRIEAAPSNYHSTAPRVSPKGGGGGVTGQYYAGFCSNTQHSGHIGQHFQTELMIEILRTIGELFLKEFSYKSDEKWPLFVDKQLFSRSASITLDNFVEGGGVR